MRMYDDMITANVLRRTAAAANADCYTFISWPKATVKISEQVH